MTAIAAREQLARAQVISEMVAEGVVTREDDTLISTIGNRRFMVEVKTFDVTEEPTPTLLPRHRPWGPLEGGDLQDRG